MPCQDKRCKNKAEEVKCGCNPCTDTNTEAQQTVYSAAEYDFQKTIHTLRNLNSGKEK